MTTDTATIDCPVKCEGCDVVVPMAGALHTEDPVYLCGKCAAGAVESQMRAERDAAIAARDEAVAAFERSGAKGLVAMAQRDAAERARDEVGIQLAAAQAEIARMQGRLSDAVALLLANNLGCVSDALGVLRRRDAVPGDALAQRGLDDDTVVKCEGCSVVLPVESAVDGSDGDGGIWLCATCADDLARDSDVPPSPAGASAQPSGSTPAASSATASSSEVAASHSAPRGTCDASVRALIDAARAVDRCYDAGASIRSSMYRLREALDGLRITAALEASGIDSSNVKGGE